MGYPITAIGRSGVPDFGQCSNFCIDLESLVFVEKLSTEISFFSDGKYQFHSHRYFRRVYVGSGQNPAGGRLQ